MSAESRPGLNEDRSLVVSLRRWKWAGVAVFLLLVVSFPLYKAVEARRRDSALSSYDQALIARGQGVWSEDCASCHGSRGQGVSAPALNSKQFLGAVTDEQMHRIVSAGIPGTAMPTWLDELGGSITDQDISAAVAYVRSWEKTAPSVPNWRTPQGSGG